ncbi:MAG: Arm DNA-binding domain-containing protein, partial [Gammaproteobacteria bacterium]
MLTDAKVRNAKPRKKAYKLTDALGLYLFVTKHGARSWRFNYRYNGRRPTATFGLYPDVSLAQARKELSDARELLRNNVDLGARKKQRRRESLEGGANTVKSIADDWYRALAPHRSESWRSNTRRWLDQLVYPEMGSRIADEVTSADVLVLVKRIAATRPKTAEYVRQTLSRVFTHGINNLRCK